MPSLLPTISTYTDDWALGQTGVRKYLMQSFQMGTSPVRFLWRCWLRWRTQILLLVLGTILSPVIALMFFSRIYKKRKSQRQQRQQSNARFRTANTTSEMQLNTVYSGPGPGSTVLERLLAMDDIFFQLARKTHAVDLLRLGLVSRSTRAIIQQHWNTHACQKYLCDGSTTHCWACDMVICKVS